MKDHEEKFEQIYFLIDSLVDEARIEGTIQHINILDTIDEFQKDFNRALFVERTDHGKVPEETSSD